MVLNRLELGRKRRGFLTRQVVEKEGHLPCQVVLSKDGATVGPTSHTFRQPDLDTPPGRGGTRACSPLNLNALVFL